MAALAERQHGVVSTGQLHAAGLGRGAIDLRVRRGRLLRVHRGVYAVGHQRLTFRGRLWAAVLACGGAEAAVLSHRTAAAFWGLSPRPSGRLELTTLHRSASTATLWVHRGSTPNPLDDVVRQPDGLPVTTVARTLVDLAQVLSPHRLERTCREAEFLRRLDLEAVERGLTGLRGRRARSLRQALASLALGPSKTRSELEEIFLSLVARFDLPRPRVNAIVAGYEVDFLWPAARLVAETDGAAAHLTAAAFERDRRRDAALQVAGFRVVRFTWHQLTGNPQEVAATLSVLVRR